MGARIDLAGQRFGRLVARECVGADRRRESVWLCRCDCEAEITVRMTALRTGNTRSCGCLHREELSARTKAATKSQVTYTGVHYRLRVARGRATEGQCHDCTGPAAEWSYDGTDPDELRDPLGRPFSLDLTRYVARCRPCHRRRDAHATDRATPYALTGVPV